MKSRQNKIFNKGSLSREDIVSLLSLKAGDSVSFLYKWADELRRREVGNNIYLRGLIEYSNICRKNCLYCGIRKGNNGVKRYVLSDDAVLEAAAYAYTGGFGSVVIQGGEIQSRGFTEKIGSLVKRIKELSNGELGITLSCGEQTEETYRYWRECGAHRYLLRFESSNRELYYSIHPRDNIHCYENRFHALKTLRDTGYQVGSGMMIGLPGQTLEHIASDLLLLKELDVDMVGLGPYIEHSATPLYKFSDNIPGREERLELTLRTIAILRILMPDINIATATALDCLVLNGRERAILAGANVLMPNITPTLYHSDYFLYDNKPGLAEASQLVERISDSPLLCDYSIGFGKWGDSKHYISRSGK